MTYIRTAHWHPRHLCCPRCQAEAGLEPVPLSTAITRVRVYF